MKQLIVIILISLFSYTSHAQILNHHGSKKQIRVKHKKSSYHLPGADNTWVIDISGPQTLHLGMRFPFKKRTKQVTVRAILDKDIQVETSLPSKLQKIAKLKGRKNLKLSKEAAISYKIPEGNHTVTITIVQKPISKSFLRILTSAPANTQIASFPIPKPEVQPPSPADDTSLASTESPAKPEPVAKPQPVEASKQVSASSVKVIQAQAVSETSSNTSSSSPQDTVAENPNTPPLQSSQTPPTQKTTATMHAKKLIPFTCGVEFGVVFPQMLAELSTSPDMRIHIGYLMPWLEQRLELFSAVSYGRPTNSVSIASTTIGSEPLQADLLVEELGIHLGILGRLFKPKTFLNAFGFAAANAGFQRSKVSGTVNSVSVSENSETSSKIGFNVGFGGELQVGPGVVNATLDFTMHDLNQEITGNVASGGIALRIGYHFLF